MARTSNTTAASTAETVKPATVKQVVALHRINGDILPGTIFTPESKEQREELFKLGAVEEPSDADVALAEKLAASASEDADLG